MDADQARALFEEHLEWAYKVARRVHSQLPPSFDVEDLEQEAAIQLWKEIFRWDPEQNNNLRGFCYLAVRGACLMSVRRKHYQENTNEELEPTVESQDANPAEQYEKRIESQRYRDRELRQLAKIRARLRAFPARMYFAAYVVRRVHLEATELPELARITGVPADRLQRTLAAGLRMLKKG